METSETFRRRHLPHWDVPGATYFVTACLKGSIPAKGLLDIQAYENELAHRPRPPETPPSDWSLQQWKLGFARAEKWLDNSPAVRHLADPELADIVANALLFFAGTRYDLLAFVVMPSHFHWVFRPLESWIETFKPGTEDRKPRERIMHSIKRFTAADCNRRLGTAGRFWQQESYDHWVRDVDELERIILYVEDNPVKAGLISEPKLWRWSSAHYRNTLGLPFGVLLPRGRVG